MPLPFTVDEFFDVFAQYNEAVWPGQVALLAVAVAAVVLVITPVRWSGVGVSAILAFLWAWLALAYHFAFFTRINPLAHVFAVVSLLGAAVFLWQGVFRRRLRFARVGGWRGAAGATLIFFALAVYPAWSSQAGHDYPHMPTFGLPCPTTIFSIGLLAFLVPPYPRSPFLVPVLWCFVGVQAAFLLGVRQDLALIVAGLVGIVLPVRSKATASPSRLGA